MKRIALCVALLAALTLLAGCSTLLKEGVGAIKGPKGIHAEVEPASTTPGERPLDGYAQFELGSFSDRYNQLPAGFMSKVQVRFDRRIAQSDLPPSSTGKTLILRGDVLYFEMSTMIGKAFGPLEEVIVRTEMVDKQSGRVIAVANCIGRTTNRVNLGLDAKADGLAKAFTDWILKNHPAGPKD
jgi:hypothetical protein